MDIIASLCTEVLTEMTQLCHPHTPLFCAVFTLYVRHGLLVLVRFTTEDGESQPLQHLSPLLQLLLLGTEQV